MGTHIKETLFLLLFFIFMPPHIYKMRMWLPGTYPFYIWIKYIETKTIFCGREFLHLGSAEFVFYSTIFHIHLLYGEVGEWLKPVPC